AAKKAEAKQPPANKPESKTKKERFV
ncbi:MAG: hypothetical protein RLZZ379_1282, partial [Pseudomonadota bacterium]